MQKYNDNINNISIYLSRGFQLAFYHTEGMLSPIKAVHLMMQSAVACAGFIRVIMSCNLVNWQPNALGLVINDSRKTININ